MDSDVTIVRAELVACLHRVAGGDHAALADLYNRTSAKLFGICLRILPDQREAEDVLQEVFLTVWNKAGQFDAALGVSPITWLAVIARNRALDRARGRARRFESLDEAAEIPDTRPLADSFLETRERDRQLEDCLQGLEARAAAAIRAAFFGGQTYQTLADGARIPLATMKSLIRRSLIRLKSCLDQ